ATGFHDGGDGSCVASGCVSGYHNGGDGKCIVMGSCASGYHNGGDGSCVATGMCASGYHDDGTGTCVTASCSSGFHDDGTGNCVVQGSCAPGYQDGGGGTCVEAGMCATGYHDGGPHMGNCVLDGTCASGYHDGGDGTCLMSGCSTNFHDGGNSKCVPLGSCSSGYHDGGTGTCLLAGNCSTGYHDDGSGTCVKNAFTAGPCVTAPDLQNIQIFATNGQHIYSSAFSGATKGAWTSLPNLDASVLDARSDLDCTSGSTIVQIAATGSNPVGAYMRSTGFGTAFNAFVRDLTTTTPATFNPPGGSVAMWPGESPTDGRYQMAAAGGNPIWIFYQSSDFITQISPDNITSLTSAPDIFMQNGSNASHFLMAAFLADGSLYEYDFNWAQSNYWLPTAQVSPPSGKTFTYSPTICATSDNGNSDYTRHLAAVAGGKLYYAHSDPGWPSDTSMPTSFSAWETAGTATPGSSPDCFVTSDDKVHIVMLTSTGTIAHIYGNTGNFTTQDLGGY
ncbi:MAG TPA: hypothetical protein VMI54_25110, partial [Polyangiaceae bacterium]|nr:hypothetical protein [Polyangiaceae bacterium]